MKHESCVRIGKQAPGVTLAQLGFHSYLESIPVDGRYCPLLSVAFPFKQSIILLKKKKIKEELGKERKTVGQISKRTSM